MVPASDPPDVREVTVSRFVRATPAELERWLKPTKIVEAEGSFDVAAVADAGEATVVTASGPGLSFDLRFEEREGGIHYEGVGDGGPFARMETAIEVDREDEGSQVTIRSAVELAAPIPLGDRIAAWKRKRELQRVLDAIEGAVG